MKIKIAKAAICCCLLFLLGALVNLSFEMNEKIKLLGENLQMAAIGASENFLVVQDRIEKLDFNYQMLLAEEKKVKFPSKEIESDVTKKFEIAKKFFRQNRYKDAYEIFDKISIFYQENNDFVFMQNYSLFKLNPMDSRNYQKIKNAFEHLKNHGYARIEIDNVLEEIRNESA